MNTIENLRTALAAHRGKFKIVARDSGLTLGWVRAFVRGGCPNPTLRRIEQLQRYLAAHPPIDHRKI